MADIQSKEDIVRLIDVFYTKVVSNDQIGYFFSGAIENWPYHKSRFVDYWESQILFKESYEGSPLQRHIDIDKHYNHGFQPAHFELWICLFDESVEELFSGEKADLAKEAAKNMAKNIYYKMFFNRKYPELNF